MSGEHADGHTFDRNASQLLAILEETVTFFQPRGSVRLEKVELYEGATTSLVADAAQIERHAPCDDRCYHLPLWEGLEIVLTVDSGEAREVRALVLATAELIEAVREVRAAGLEIQRGRFGDAVEAVASRVHLAAKVAASLREWGSVTFLRFSGEVGTLREPVLASALRSWAMWLAPDGSTILALEGASRDSALCVLSRVVNETEKRCLADVTVGFVVAEYGMGVTDVMDAVLDIHGTARTLLEFLEQHPLPLGDLYSILELRRAISNGGVSISYQMINSLQRGVVDGVEAFVRWEHPLRQWRGAQEVLNLAEAVSLTPALGWFVTSEAVGKMSSHAGGTNKRLHLNVSASQINHPGFALMLVASGSGAGLDIVVEFQEKEIPYIEQGPIEVLLAGGVALAVDGFGGGSSALSYLTWLQPSILKVPLCGWEHLTPGRERYLRGLLGCAESVGAALYGTCVEHEAVADGLKNLGLSHAQGAYYSRPGECAASL
jgi:EAL domain-containing protein (putative c-di-GMP-specific phosphodiesterase class I)